MRLSVTERCNLRCRYCMPESGICKKKHEEMLTEEEMIRAVEAASRLGIRKVRITGGEPLVKKNILSICEKVAATEGIEEVCITTNGTLLPELAKTLKNAGVRRVNISLDTLDAEKYRHLTRWGNYEDVWKGIHSAFEAGFEQVKLNTVLLGGVNDEEIEDFVNLTSEYPMDVRFIELMPMYDGGDFGPEAFIPYSRVIEAVPELFPVGKDSGEKEDSGKRGISKDAGVAKLFRLPDGKGNVGLISPVNAHFCGTCNRLRLTADGKLKPCLHSKEEFSIKGMALEEMVEEMKKAIYAKPACHKELSYEKRSESGRNMNRIGG